MPVPFILAGIAIASTLYGGVKGVKAVKQQTEANEVNSRAQRIFDNAIEELEEARENSKFALERLGKKKLDVADKSINRFVSVYEKIHNIEITDTIGLKELNKFRIDKQSVVELKRIGEMASSMASGMATGGLAGGLMAFGAYSAAMTFGVASTGTAIAALSGAAATKATLAFLGGGALAAGGFGVAGGMAILGGVVAGPALAVLGTFMAAKAGKNRDNAYSNLAEAKKYQEVYRKATELCNAISKRANMFNKLLAELDEIFRQGIISLETIVSISGTDFKRYNIESKKMVAAACSVAGAVKAVLDTPILTMDGGLTKESEKTGDEILDLLNSMRQEA